MIKQQDKSMPNHHQPREEVIIFTRYPEPGKVKTRLVPFLGAEKTARMHRELTEHIIRQILPLCEMRCIQISLHYTGGSFQQMKNWLKHNFLFLEQQKGDIGIKMAAAIQSSWDRGIDRSVVIGTDVPLMEASILAQALDYLMTNDVVLGPAYDGGYYLIGVNHDLSQKQISSLFRDISWGSAEVFQQTLHKAEEHGLRIATLKKLHDIDRVEDLEHFNHYSDAQ